jgi:hypothetical protein
MHNTFMLEQGGRMKSLNSVYRLSSVVYAGTVPAVLRRGSVALLLMALIGTAAGCVTARAQCEKWKSEGFLFSTVDGCVTCAQRMGTSNIDAVRGCALGVDTADLLATNTAQTQE